MDTRTIGPPVSSKKKAIVEGLFLVVFIVGAIYVLRFTPAHACLTAETLGDLLDSLGIWVPIAYMTIFSVGLFIFSFFIPKIIKGIRVEEHPVKGTEK